MLVVLESELFRTTSTIIHTSDYILIVDPNWLPREVEYIYDLVNQFPANIPRYLLFTHSDYDHIIGANAFPEAIVIASKAFSENPNKKGSTKSQTSSDDDLQISLCCSRVLKSSRPETTSIVSTKENCHFKS